MEFGSNENHSTEEEKRLFRLYGKSPCKGDLLQRQLKTRHFFDSGDFILSKANKASDVGVVQTGGEHPTPENTSHPSAPVPSSSNVAKAANDQPHDRRGSVVAKESHLQQEFHVGVTAAESPQVGGVGAPSGAAAGLQHAPKK